ncbi:MAG: ribonuclease III [Eubacteriales bacterium]|nr:ribonuclease III [Eubacteriales bacterium]
MQELRELQSALGYEFKQEALLRLALTHPSTKEPQDNQRLEFLGDAVLEFCVSDVLYRKYQERQEGELTARRAALVCEETLCTLAKAIGLGPYLRMGHGEELMHGREKPSILSDAMESVIAAVYLDGGINAAYQLIRRLFRDEEKLAARKGKDDKGLLQAYTQAHELGLPEYVIVDESGPDHARVFMAEVRVMGQPVARGGGASKKAAEQLAARLALEGYTKE